MFGAEQSKSIDDSGTYHNETKVVVYVESNSVSTPTLIGTFNGKAQGAVFAGISMTTTRYEYQVYSPVRDGYVQLCVTAS
jgi:hypothetical protein